MAAFRKRSNGWQVRIRRKGYPEVNKSFPARKKAESWARGIESEIDRGVFVSRVEADNTTLAELLNRYLKEIRPQKKRASLMGVKTILTKAQSTAGATGKNSALGELTKSSMLFTTPASRAMRSKWSKFIAPVLVMMFALCISTVR